jgi:hypothetical protein
MSQVSDYEQAYKIAMSAGWDAGNRSAAKAGRKAWDEKDWDLAAQTQRQVMASLGHQFPTHLADAVEANCAAAKTRVSS